MTRQELVAQIQLKKSYLCIGLDTDPDRIPAHLQASEDPIFEFNKQIIAATQDLCVAYKPNIAFYEALGAAGWRSLEKTLALIQDTHFIIADAKRGDIGNTSKRYAKAFFETLACDAVTVAPYMGGDSVKPFLGFPGKWVVLLALTSNRGSEDFQLANQPNGQPLYEKVMRKAMEWGSPDELMFVIGATHPDKITEIRRIAPDHFLLVPGVGAQGGDLQAISERGLIPGAAGLLINSSRGIIYAGDGEDFADHARLAAQKLQQQMATFLT